MQHATRPDPICRFRWNGSSLAFPDNLFLQLSFVASFPLAAAPVGQLGDGLVYASPEGPGKEMVEHYAGGTLEPADEMADLACAEIDQRSRLLFPPFRGGAAFSFTRMLARKARASMASVMCRYQPCQERIS